MTRDRSWLFFPLGLFGGVCEREIEKEKDVCRIPGKEEALRLSDLIGLLRPECLGLVC